MLVFVIMLMPIAAACSACYARLVNHEKLRVCENASGKFSQKLRVGLCRHPLDGHGFRAGQRTKESRNSMFRCCRGKNRPFCKAELPRVLPSSRGSPLHARPVCGRHAFGFLLRLELRLASTTACAPFAICPARRGKYQARGDERNVCARTRGFIEHTWLRAAPDRAFPSPYGSVPLACSELAILRQRTLRARAQHAIHEYPSV